MGDNTLYEPDINGWEKKRIWFNVIVGTTGLGVIMTSQVLFFLHYFLIKLLFYGVIANVFYTMGYMLEVWDVHYFKGRLRIQKYKRYYFVLGSLSYALVTFLLATLIAVNMLMGF